MRKLPPKLVRSYALDAIATQSDLRQPPAARTVRAFVVHVAAADVRRARGVGLGEEVRLAGEGLAGGALVDRDRVVHLSPFRLDAGRKPRVRRFSRRAQRFRDAG